ncbi:MAG: hypothetical protein ACI8PZ_005166, partial [Myxococcota bacterium]
MLIALLCALATAEPLSDHAEIHWSPDGTAVYVSGWRHTPADGAWTRVHEGRGRLALSPSGKPAWIDDTVVHLVDPSPRALELRRLVPPEGHVNTAGYWLDDGHLYVHQSRPYDGGDEGCAVIDVASGAHSMPPGGCIEPDMSIAWRFARGPEGLVAVFSASEGVPVVQIIRYTPEAGPSGELGPSVDLYASGLLDVVFAPDGGSAWLVTSCALDRVERPCATASGSEAAGWWVHRWGFEDRRLEGDATVISTRAVLGPDGEAVAVIRDGELCVGPVV